MVGLNTSPRLKISNRIKTSPRTNCSTQTALLQLAVLSAQADTLAVLLAALAMLLDHTLMGGA